MLDETDFFKNLNFNHNITETVIDKIYIKRSLEHRIQQQEKKDSGWRFDKIKSIITYFFKSDEIKGECFVEISLRSNAILSIENNDKYCFLCSRLASLHPCNNNHPNRASTSV